MVERLDVNLLEMRALEVQTLHRGVTLTVNAFGVVDGTVVVTIFEFHAVYSRLVCIMLFLFVGFFNNGIHMHRRYVFTLDITIVICLRYLPVVLVGCGAVLLELVPPQLLVGCVNCRSDALMV